MAQEFQVVLLAGGTGSRMYPLTEEIPKYMLPIANRPLLSYQLELLEKVGFGGKVFTESLIPCIYSVKSLSLSAFSFYLH